MTWQPEESTKALEKAGSQFDWDEARRLVSEFVAHLQSTRQPYPESGARAVLAPLRRKRQFSLLIDAADALIVSGNGSFKVRRDYAQGLLDSGQLTAAHAVLDDLLDDTTRALTTTANDGARAETERMKTEARGLLGRLYKQCYVDALGPKSATAARTPRAATSAALGRAFGWYWQVYRESPSDPERRWHAVNALALACRARTDQISLPVEFEPKELAADLIGAVQAAWDERQSTVWDHAVAMEASLATADLNQAKLWTERYLQTEQSDAFELASTLRQLEEVWQLSVNQPLGARLLPALRAKLLAQEGGSIAFDETELQQREERVFGESFIPLELYLLGVERARAVARIGTNPYQGAGTGFLVRGGDLHPAWGNGPLLVTNSHVTNETSPYGLRADSVCVSFLVRRSKSHDPFTTSVAKVVWESPRRELDTCVLQLAAYPDDVAPCPIGKFNAAENKHIFIAGYPSGDSLKFSLFDNLVVEHNSQLIRYRNATEKGSSGSPVFNRDWSAVAIHHAGGKGFLKLDGSGQHAANEGILLSAVIAAIRKDGRG